MTGVAKPEFRRCDVLVVGGGPAGSTAGALLARRGHDVVVVEKDNHPRFHIGESLLPMNLPILDRLGVLDAVEGIGVPKMGADFTYSDRGDFHTFHFDRALGNSPPNAFEVRRAEFDKLLIDAAAHEGATVMQSERVIDVARIDSGYRVTSRDSSGRIIQWNTRFVVDASGRDRWLSGSLGCSRRNAKHGSAAVYGHFSNVPRRTGRDQGNISVYWFDGGWIWMIPLRDDVMSVGAVCRPDILKALRAERGGDAEATLRAVLGRCAPARQRMQGAKLQGSARGAGNYSYSSSKLMGDGYALIGDAFAFVDPVFSSGVYLAMSSAERAVPAVDAWLNGNRKAFRQQRKAYIRDTRQGLKNFAWFIYRFTSPAMRSLFEKPRNTWQVEQAVISMLAGDVFGNPLVQRRLRIFRLIYGLTCLRMAVPSLRAWLQRRRSARITFAENH